MGQNYRYILSKYIDLTIFSITQFYQTSLIVIGEGYEKFSTRVDVKNRHDGKIQGFNKVGY